MGAKLAATIFALVFIVPFGGAGLVAGVLLAKTLVDTHRARDWVAVQANVDEAALAVVPGSRRYRASTRSASATYRYTIGGKEYVGTRLGFYGSGSDNLGDWQEKMAASLEAARAQGRTITVYVNPEDPADSVVDRELRREMVGLMAGFTAAFGGIGLVATIGLGLLWLGKAKAKEPSPASPVIALGIFALLWNGVSWLVAYLATTGVVATKGLGAVLVWLFPLIGLFLLWGAIKHAFLYWRGGPGLARARAHNPQLKESS